MYDFTGVYPRHDKGSDKWNAALAAGASQAAIPLTVADMEFKTAPEIIDAVKDMAEFGLWGYTMADAHFKAAVTRWMEKRHGWQAPAELLVATPGVVPALSVALRAFTQEGDGVLVQPPVYPPLFLQAKRNNRKIIENPLRLAEGKYQIDFEDLAVKAKQAKMLLLCSPHNPVGRVWSFEELDAIAAICAAEDVIVFADEIHHDIVMPGHKHTTSAHVAKRHPTLKTIIATAASKTFSLAGLSCSSIFLPDEEWKKRYEKQMGQDSIHFNSTFGVVATIAGYEKGEVWLENMISVVHQNYQQLCSWAEALQPALWVSPLEATYLAWVDCTALGLSDKALMEFTHQKADFFANSGADYSTGGTGFLRINLACPNGVLSRQLEKLGNAIENKDKY